MSYLSRVYMFSSVQILQTSKLDLASGGRSTMSVPLKRAARERSESTPRNWIRTLCIDRSLKH